MGTPGLSSAAQLSQAVTSMNAPCAGRPTRGITLKNRIMSTAHAPGCAEAGLPGECYQSYHEEKAKGGLALTMFGGNLMVSAEAPSCHTNVSNGRCIEPFRAFARRIHGHGCATMCQLTHLGRRTRPGVGTWLPILAPSDVREPLHRGFPKVLEPYEIARIVDDFAAAAARCRAAAERRSAAPETAA